MPTWEEIRYQVAQAQRIVSTQAGCTRDEALFLIIERAQDRQQSLADITSAIIEGRIRFGLETQSFSTRQIVCWK